MTMDPNNYKHVTTTCPECKHDEILMDPEHEIIYCTHCGLVIEENTIFRITHAINEVKRKESFIRSLWHRKVK